MSDAFDHPPAVIRRRALAVIGAFLLALVVWAAALRMWWLAGTQLVFLVGVGLQVWGQEREARGAEGRRLRIAGLAILAVLAAAFLAHLAGRGWAFLYG
jgi:hypothetical protein